MGTLPPKVADASLAKLFAKLLERSDAGAVSVASGSPYARLGLWRNPFGELSRAERAELALIDVEACLAKLATPHSALQILGPCGHGKTTHLLAIERAAAGCGYVYFPEDGAQPPLPCGRPLLVDEAQRLGWRRRRQLLCGSGPLVLGTHVDMSSALGRAGFEVFTIDVSIPQTPAQLQRMLNRRIEVSRLQSNCARAGEASAHPLCLTLDDAVALQQQLGSNIRRIEHHLYEVFQRLAEKGELWRPAK